MPTTRLLLTIVALFALAGSVAAAAQPASPQASPVPDGFELVAYVSPDEWREPLPDVEPIVDLDDQMLLEALRQGGFVIYFRHASTDFSQVDEDPVDLTDCTTQRNLSEAGRRESRRIGESMDDLGIPIGDVLSSEMCRARDTAELVFGEVTTTSDLTALTTARCEAEKGERTGALRDLLATPAAPGTNTVLVGHLVNITVAANVTMDEAEAAIFLPVG